MEHGFAPRTRHGRTAMPAGRLARKQTLGRRTPTRGTLPTAAAETRRAAARRAYQPPRRRINRLARTASAAIRGHRHRRHTRQILPRRRERMDSRTRPRRRNTMERQLLVVARPEDNTHGTGRGNRIKAQKSPRKRARMDQDGTQGTTGKRQGTPQLIRRHAQPGAERTRGETRNLHTQRPAPRQQGHQRRTCRKGIRRESAVQRPQLHAAA